MEKWPGGGILFQFSASRNLSSLFWRLLALVNADRVKRKLPSLLVDGDTSKKANYNKFMRTRYRLSRFKRRNPERFNTLTNKVISDLAELEKAVSSKS
jgi:hypothetical protein